MTDAPPIASVAMPHKVTTSPIVTGSSVIGIVYKDGVMLASDTLASYGNLARYSNASKLRRVGDYTILGCSGEYSDFQWVMDALAAKVARDSLDEDVAMGAGEIHSYLSRVMYARRNKGDPLYCKLLVAGFKDGKSFLGYLDQFGTAFHDTVAATGMGMHLALPLLRARASSVAVARPDESSLLSEAEARTLLTDALRVLWYRDCRALNRVQIAKVTAAGPVVEEPFVLDAKWDYSAFMRPKAGVDTGGSCYINAETQPVNITLRNIIMKLFPDTYASREAAAAAERSSWAEKLPLFSLGDALFPFTHTHLHLFEPRYRVMLERIASARPGMRKFGWVTSYSPGSGEMGTVVEIKELTSLPTGSFLVSGRATGRFTITQSWTEEGTGGLNFGRIARVVDCDEAGATLFASAASKVVNAAVAARAHTAPSSEAAPRARSPLELVAAGIALGPESMLTHAHELEAAGSPGVAVSSASASASGTDSPPESLGSSLSGRMRAAARQHELAASVWRNYALVEVCARNLLASLRPDVLANVASQLGECPLPCACPVHCERACVRACSLSCDPLTSALPAVKLSFWLAAILPLPSDVRTHLYRTTSVGERLWILFQLAWPRYGLPQLDPDLAALYVQCNSYVREVHSALAVAAAANAGHEGARAALHAASQAASPTAPVPEIAVPADVFVPLAGMYEPFVSAVAGPSPSAGSADSTPSGSSDSGTTVSSAWGSSNTTSTMSSCLSIDQE